MEKQLDSRHGLVQALDDIQGRKSTSEGERHGARESESLAAYLVKIWLNTKLPPLKAAPAQDHDSNDFAGFTDETTMRCEASCSTRLAKSLLAK